MSLNLNEIGEFQFENLIKSRIPFVLINLTTSLPTLFAQSFYQKHVESIEIRTQESEVLNQLKERNHPLHEAILIICEDGQRSKSLVALLESNGYLNVFFMAGGMGSLAANAMR